MPGTAPRCCARGSSCTRFGSDHAFRLELVADAGGDRLNWLAEESASLVRFDVEPQASGLRRLWRDMLGVVIPEHML